MNKPIESGCKVRLVNCMNPINEGKIATVVRFLGRVHGWDGDRRWEIDRVVYGAYQWFITGTSQTSAMTGLTITNTPVFHVHEHQLQRIDDYNGDEKISWSDMEDIWVPKLIKELSYETNA